ncbi:hypothetical protein BOTBODRAFT_174802 [Botryobasidium botryosum FD-172 SS1]|uniref:Uncharacterized protein n=1 Tax=Botryobasidium botryosum (strain FD-172 SS1) TaxID=930990 RepID=A0A067MEV1_BOTB1|nr:hypothetical protein BOTBODRAFT_174802 [Botryobasidium botryosum FD-172 SS1]
MPPPHAYAWMEQRRSRKTLFITAIARPPAATGARSHPARSLRPLRAFRHAGTQTFPLLSQTPVLAPTVAWRKTDAKGRALLAFASVVDPIPLTHPSHTFSAHCKVVYVGVRPRWLLEPIPFTTPARDFAFACRVFSGHCPSPAYYHRIHPELFPLECLCGFSPCDSAHVALDCPLRADWAHTTPPFDSDGPASSPGSGSPSTFWGRLAPVPSGFEWATIPITPATNLLRDTIAYAALDDAVLSPFELRQLIEVLPQTPL